MSHLYFNELSQTDRKTKLYEVTVTASDEILGRVGFYGAWRKYTFSPYAGTTYDHACLREIADFAEAQTKKWREGIQERKQSCK